MTDQVGSAAEEAGRLFAVAESWLRNRAGSWLDGEHLANGSAACAVCPVCQAIAALRQIRPETVEHLLAAATGLVASLRPAGGPGQDHEQPAEPAPEVERIQVRDE